jgi:hypothetical protein
MSLSQETMLELMQYADGELEGDARARIEALLQTSDQARGIVEAMGALGEVVRDGVDARANASAGGYGIADAVMAAVAGDAARAQDAHGGVVPIGNARSARRARTGVTSAVVAALALAAGVFLFVTTKAPAPTAKEEPVSSMPASAPLAPAAIAPSAGAAPEEVAKADAPGVDLEEVRSIRNKVNVFFMPAAASAGAVAPGAAASVVVWIDDRHGGQ